MTVFLLSAACATAQAQNVPGVARFSTTPTLAWTGAGARVGNLAFSAAQESGRFTGVLDLRSDAQVAQAVARAAGSGVWNSPIHLPSDSGWKVNLLFVGSVDMMTYSESRSEDGKDLYRNANVSIAVKLFDIGNSRMLASANVAASNQVYIRGGLSCMPKGDTQEQAIELALNNLWGIARDLCLMAFPPRITDITYAEESTVTRVLLNAGRSAALRKNNSFAVISLRLRPIGPDEVLRDRIAVVQVADDDPVSVHADVL